MTTPYLTQLSELLNKSGIHGLESIYSIIFTLFLKNNILNDIQTNDLFSKLNKQLSTENILDSFEQVNNNLENTYQIKKFNQNIDIFIKIYELINTIDFKKIDISNIISETMDFSIEWENLVWVKEYIKFHKNKILSEWIYNLVKPKISNAMLNEIVLDANLKINSYIDLIIEKIHKEKQINNTINWTTIKNKLYGVQIDPIIRSLNIMKLKQSTNENFSTNIMSDNIILTDFTVGPKSYDLIFCDLPVGLHNMIHANCCKRVKDLKLRGTKAEPLFLQLFMQSLNKNGRCIVMVPDSFLFSDSVQPIETRKYLMENFNIKKIIQIDENLFAGKNNRNSIIYFENTGKTTNIVFSKIKLTNGKIEEQSIMNVSPDRIKTNMFSLFYKNYEPIDKSEKVNYDKVSRFFTIEDKPLENNPDALILVLNKYYKSEQSIHLCKSSELPNHIDGNIYIWFKSPENNIFETQYLEFLIKTNYEYAVRGKMNQFDKDKIRELEVPILDSKVQTALKNYLFVTNNLIKSQTDEIKMYQELKKILMDSIPFNQMIELGKMTEIFDSEAKPEIKSGEIIIGIIRNSLAAGTVYIKKPDEPFSTNSHYVRVIDPQIKAGYLYHFMKHMEPRFMELANLTTQPNLTKPTLAGLPVKVISLEEQEGVISEMGELNMAIQMKEIANRKLKEKDIISTVINLQKSCIQLQNK